MQTSQMQILSAHAVRTDDACHDAGAKEEPAQDAAQLWLKIEEHDVTQQSVVLRRMRHELQ